VYDAARWIGKPTHTDGATPIRRYSCSVHLINDSGKSATAEDSGELIEAG
jgi:hypothetical protein